MIQAKERNTEVGRVPTPHLRGQGQYPDALVHAQRAIDNANVTICLPLPLS